MIAFRMATELDMLRPPIVRVHEVPAEFADEVTYAAALSFPQHATVRQTIDALRQIQSDVDNVYYLFVTDFDEHLVGVVNLHHLVIAEQDAELYQIMDQRLITLSPDATLEEQARILSESGLMALPVVDDQGRLVGAMDTSDLIRALQAETTGQMHELAGLHKDETTTRPLVQTIGDRLLWLVINLMVVALAALVISSFAHVLANVVILAAFLPIVLALGHAAGVQTLTLVTRALAVGQARSTDARRLLGRELVLGAVNGVGIGLLAGVVGWLWQGSIALGIVVGGALLATLLLAALAGVLVPFGLKLIRIERAAAAKVCVTTLTTVCGFACLLGLCTLALQLGYL